MSTVKLPDGQTATLKLITHGLEVTVANLMRRTQRELDSTEDASDYVAAVIVLLVESWTLETPLTVDGVSSLEPRIVDPLYAAAMKNFREATEDTLPQA